MEKIKIHKKTIITFFVILMMTIVVIIGYSDLSILGSKSCVVKSDCQLIKTGRDSGCWSRKPIKIGFLEILWLSEFIGCECVNKQCVGIVGK